MGNRRWKTGFLSALLTLSISLSMLPAPVLAAGATDPGNAADDVVTAEATTTTEALVTDDTAENALLPTEEQEADAAVTDTIAKADTAEEAPSVEEERFPEPVDIAEFDETIDKSYTLTSNRTISGDLLISADVDLAGYSLTVTGNVQHTNGNIRFNNGTLSIGGNYVERSTEVENGDYKNSWGKLYFENSGDSMIVNGDFIAKSSAFGWFKAGKLELKGDLTDYTGNTIYADYNAESTHVTTFSGTGKQVVDLKNDHCFHIIHTVNTNVQFKQIGFETMDQNVILTGDVSDIPDKLDLNGNTLTINGSVTKLDGSDLHIGKGTLCITGNFQHVNGNIYFEEGSLKIEGSYVERSTEVEKGSYKNSWGKLYFENEKDSMVVGGDFIAQSSAFGWFKAGTLELKGNVTDYTGNTIYADYNTESTHVTIFSGTGTQVVDLQKDHCFHIIHTPNKKVQFKQIGFETMDQDVTLTGDVSDMHDKLDMNGKTLTINGNVTKLDGCDLHIAGGNLHITGNFQHANGNIYFENGTLQIDGSYIERSPEVENGAYKNSWGKLFFENAGDHMVVGGDFIAQSSAFGWLTAGKLECRGNVTDITGNTIYADYNTSSTHITIFNGSEEQVVDLKKDHCFHIVRATNPLVRFKQIGFETLDQDLSLTGDVDDIWDKLDLNGHTLTIYGNVTKLNGSELHLNTGKLHITGNFQHANGNIYFENGTLQVDGSYIERSPEVESGAYKNSWGKLYFENDDDHMIVGGDFIAQSSAFGWFKAGLLEIKGDVEDKTGNTIYANYNTESTHKTILNGSKHQTVTCSNKHFFHFLEITQPRTSYTFNPDPCWYQLIEGSAVPVSGVSLNRTSLPLTVGGTQYLVATILPSAATNQSVTWNSDAPGIATVNAQGLVTAVAEGTAIITVTTADGGKTATCTVTVTAGGEPGPGPTEVSVTGITLDKSNLTVKVGESFSLTSTITPSNATNTRIKWTFSRSDGMTGGDGSYRDSDSAVYTYNLSDGLDFVGQITYTVTTEDGGYTASCVVTVTDSGTPDPGVVPVTGVSLEKSELTVKLGESYTLTGTITPANATNKRVKWRWIDDEGSVHEDDEYTDYGSSTFSQGFDTLKTGKVTVTVITEDGGYTASCVVTITEGGTPDPGEVAVTNLTLDRTTAEIGVGEAIVLTSTIWPSNATKTDVTWTTSEDGLNMSDRVFTKTRSIKWGKNRVSTFTGIAARPGTVTVTVTSEDGLHSASCTVTVMEKSYDVHVNSVTLDKTKLAVKVGETGKITATVAPGNGDDLTVYWTYLQSEVGILNKVKTSAGTTTANPTFEFTAEKAGHATVYVTTRDGGYTAECEITVTGGNTPGPGPDPGDVKVTGISLDKTKLSLNLYDSAMLLATVKPANATNRKIVWTTSDDGKKWDDRILGETTGVEQGEALTFKFSVKKTGTVTITATTEDSGYKASCKVTVKKGASSSMGRVTSIALDKSALIMKVGDTATLTSRLTPLNVINDAVTWSVSDPTVVSGAPSGSDDGISVYSITALKAGSATVKATTEDGNKTATCSIIVGDSNPYGSDEPSLPGDWAVWDYVDGAEVTVSLTYTDETEYDGRKHVVDMSSIGGKATKETASVNPDIKISRFAVLLDGVVLPGISISAVACKNNQLPSFDGVTNTFMYLCPTLKYNTKDPALNAVMKMYPKLKMTLNRMVKPTYNKRTDEWTYDPIDVNIRRIDLSGTEVYTLADLSSNPGLKTTDGILVWNGKPYSKNISALVTRDTHYCTKFQYKGLYYQKVFYINNKYTVKKINLRPGVWKGYSNKNNPSDGYLVMSSAAFDYYPQRDFLGGGSSYPPMYLNDGDNEDWSTNPTKVKLGYFTGQMPDIIE